MTHRLAVLGFLVPTLWAGASFAQLQMGEPAPAPDTLILAESNFFDTGASSNFPPVVTQILDEYYRAGACEQANNWQTCDDIRFGLAIHAGVDCADTGDKGPLTWFYTPDEDSGADVRGRLQTVFGERGTTFCDDDAFLNHDTGVRRAWELTFPGTTSANDDDLNKFWERPHLNFWGINNLPQSSDGSPDDRAYQAIKQTCEMFEGPGGLPSMPTWVLVERQSTSPVYVYSGLIAAAGGTGMCEIYRAGSWVPIDVCDHLADVDETELRAGIAAGVPMSCNRNNQCPTNSCVGGVCRPQNGAYRCGASDDPDKSSYATGALAAPLLQDMRCQLSGGLMGSCRNSTPTDLFGVFQCVRQMPRGFSAPVNTPEDPDGWVVRFCEGGIPINDGQFSVTCADGTAPIYLRESQGDIQFIDEERTLFVITDRRYCDGGAIDVFECPLGDPCDTGGVGRCADGQIVCPDGVPICKPQFDDYPEICNGLDDDCDGKVDNLSESWESLLYINYSLPTEHEGLDCNLLDTCVCPDGITDLKAGATFDEYLDAWGGACMCGEGLAPDTTPAPATTDTGSESACSAVATDSIPASFLALALLGFARIVRRR